MLEPGTQIAPYLRLLRELGEGGMGRVWVAQHQTLETEVAVKFLNRDLAQDGHWLARFRREAQAVAKIDSAHVVRVFDHGVTAENEPYIVMELLRGESLGERLARLGPLPIDEAILIVTQTCKALGRAHSVGVVHRDVKPENVFLTREGDELFVKLLDFGVAKQVTPKGLAITDSYALIGTPYYMSPEQVMSTQSVDHRADLWGLAVVAYQMLTGARPFEGATLAAIGMQINASRYTAATVLRAGLPAAVDEWFRRGLCRDIEARFASSHEMGDAFCRAFGVANTPQLSSRFSSMDASRTVASTATVASVASVASVRTTGRHDRRGWALMLTAIVLLVSLGVFAWVWLAGPRPRAGDERVAPPAPPRMPALDATSSPAAGHQGHQGVPLAGQAQEPVPAPRETPKAPETTAQSATPSASPPAHPPVHKVRGGSAPTESAKPPSPPPSTPRPLKDRGF